MFHSFSVYPRSDLPDLSLDPAFGVLFFRRPFQLPPVKYHFTMENAHIFNIDQHFIDDLAMKK